jgi:flavin reductase (DIM6/NTAB) family NADH-FMN oxidoreductase RutF
VDQEAKKRVLRSVPYGLFALGVRGADGAMHATLVAWLTQVSFEPPMVGVALERESATLPLVRAAGAFALGVLPRGAVRLASRLGRSSAATPGKLEGLAHRPAPASGAPLFEEATGWLECRVCAEVAAGDHVVVVAEVVEAGVERDEETLTLRETGFRYAG